MTSQDLERIEAALGISLPDSYKRVMRDFPIPAFRGNADTDLWDDADRLIERNLELRTAFVRGHEPWTARWFFIGDPLTACGNAIDLDDPADAVLWIDHCALRTIRGAKGEPFEAWALRWAEEAIE